MQSIGCDIRDSAQAACAAALARAATVAGAQAFEVRLIGTGSPDRWSDRFGPGTPVETSPDLVTIEGRRKP